MGRIDYRVYLVTDDPSRYGGDWLEKVVAAVEGGVTCVQYRDTESPREVQYARVRRLMDALRPRGVPTIVNNDAELAAAVRAEGVHVGQGDLPPERVREIVGSDCEIGWSITESGQLDKLPPLAGVVNALGIGPVFDARKTKADASEAMGVEGLADILHSIPSTFSTVAIGGITLENAAGVLATGVGGLAVVSAFSKAVDPYDTAKKFSMLFDHRRI